MRICCLLRMSKSYIAEAAAIGLYHAALIGVDIPFDPIHSSEKPVVGVLICMNVYMSVCEGNIARVRHYF